MTAAHYKLDNLIAIVDYNKLQITGPTPDVCNIEPLAEKFAAFGWSVGHVDGHSINDLGSTLSQTPLQENKPTVFLARTVKGKGISFMENNKKWHHRVPDDIEYQRALQELENLTETSLISD